jgi:signal transduction histidine kinase
MHEPLKRLAYGASRWFDPAAALLIAGFCLIELINTPPHGTGLTVAIAAASALGSLAVLMRRRYPLTIALIVATVLFVPGVLIGARWQNELPATLLLGFVIIGYTVGCEVGGGWSVFGLVALALGNTTGDLSPDLASVLVFTVPPWVAGRVMRSRNQLAAELDARAHELESEQEAYVREAVRFERARIARDLHDIVAHNLSMIVVQAGAGRRALESSPEIATESLEHISAGVLQAEMEIESLIGLVGRQREANGAGPGLQMLDELVRRAAGTGLSVTYRVSGAHDAVPPELAQAAYHVTQEGITNALKHAPGAPITVAVDASARTLKVSVENGAAGAGETGVGDSGLQSAGGGYGIAGLRQRLEAIGGSLTAGPSDEGGWRLEADLHRKSAIWPI